MATTERPPIKIGGKRNPEYDRWYREQKKAASQADEHPTELPASDPAPDSAGDPGSEPVGLEAVAGGEDEPSGEVREVAWEQTPERAEAAAKLAEYTQVFAPPVHIDLTKEGEELDAELNKLESVFGVPEDFQSAAEPEQTTNDDPREPEVAPALEPLKDGEVIEITVDRIARNKSFVYGDLNGELVPIRVKKKTGPKLVGKPINVTVTVEAGHTLFTHTP